MEFRHAQYELQKSIRAAKRTSIQRLESCSRENNTRRMWQGIQSFTNYRKDASKTVIRDASLLDNLNSYYARFDQHNRDMPLKAPCDPEETALWVTHTQVLRYLRQVNPCKAVGPDHVAKRVPKACAEQLEEVYTDIFNTSLLQKTVPGIFMSSVTVPVPKKTKHNYSERL